jgi:hypothetical protein
MDAPGEGTEARHHDMRQGVTSEATETGPRSVGRRDGSRRARGSRAMDAPGEGTEARHHDMRQQVECRPEPRDSLDAR